MTTEVETQSKKRRRKESSSNAHRLPKKLKSSDALQENPANSVPITEAAPEDEPESKSENAPATNGHTSLDKKDKKEKRKKKTEVPVNGTNKTRNEDNAAQSTDRSSRDVNVKDEITQKARKVKKDLLEQPSTPAHVRKSKRKDIKLAEANVGDVEPESAAALIHTMPESNRVSPKPRIPRITPWIATEQSGGRFLALDPVFSVDEKYVYQSFLDNQCLLSTDTFFSLPSMPCIYTPRLLHYLYATCP
jgi:hypothetical protein